MKSDPDFSFQTSKSEQTLEVSRIFADKRGNNEQPRRLKLRITWNLNQKLGTLKQNVHWLLFLPFLLKEHFFSFSIIFSREAERFQLSKEEALLPNRLNHILKSIKKSARKESESLRLCGSSGLTGRAAIWRRVATREASLINQKRRE